MDSNLSIYRFFLTIFCSILIMGPLSAAAEPYGTKEIFEACNFQGKESANSNNVNCTTLPVPNLWDDSANNRCINEYVKGCNLAKIESFCHLGSNDFLKTNKCTPLNRTYEYGMDFYGLCCSVCEKGRNAYLKKESCTRSLPLDTEMPQLIVHAEFENCCSSKATKSLRRSENYEEADLFDEDFNICAKSGCDHFCVEIDYNKAQCSCRNGFELNKDGRKCDDINECKFANECLSNQKCNNLQGSYECLEIVLNSTASLNETRNLNLRNLNESLIDKKVLKCKNESYFDPIRNVCVDMIDKYENFCLDEKCNTNIRSIMDNSSKCKDGHRLTESGFCEDLDECAVAGTCSSDQKCINRIGNFACLNKSQTFECEPGLIKNGEMCQDVNECLSDKCDKDKKCINLIGSYACVNKSRNEFNSTDNSSLQSRESESFAPVNPLDCESGQELNSKGECVDKDICGENPGICGENATCTSFLGKHECACNDGFEKNETTKYCQDKNECETSENICSEQTSTCENLIGSYECTCKAGFEKQKNGTVCNNVDECKDKKIHGCDHECLDSYGSFECTCREGYELQSDKKTCSEIDQCHAKDFCDGICERIAEGNYRCEKCKSGFNLDKDKKRCLSINNCNLPNYCREDDSCIHLKNGKSVCVNLKCPEGYSMSEEDNVCIKDEKIIDSQPLSIGKRVIFLPSSYSEANKIVYRFKKPEEKLTDVELKIEISDLSKDEPSLDENYFSLVEQKISHNLLLVKPIKKERNFIIEMNAIYRDKIKLHKSILYVYVV